MGLISRVSSRTYREMVIQLEQRQIAIAAFVLSFILVEILIYYYDKRSYDDSIISYFTFGIIEKLTAIQSILLLTQTKMNNNYLKVRYGLDSLNECVADDIYKRMDPTGMYGWSVVPRKTRPKHLKFRVGHIVRHKKYGY